MRAWFPPLVEWNQFRSEPKWIERKKRESRVSQRAGEVAWLGSEILENQIANAPVLQGFPGPLEHAEFAAFHVQFDNAG